MKNQSCSTQGKKQLWSLEIQKNSDKIVKKTTQGAINYVAEDTFESNFTIWPFKSDYHWYRPGWNIHNLSLLEPFSSSCKILLTI